MCGASRFASITQKPKDRKPYRTYMCRALAYKDDDYVKSLGISRFHLSRGADTLDEFIENIVRKRLADPAIVEGLIATPEVNLAELDKRREEINAELDEIAKSKFPVRQRTLMADPLFIELADIERKIQPACAAASTPSSGHQGSGRDLRRHARRPEAGSHPGHDAGPAAQERPARKLVRLRRGRDPVAGIAVMTLDSDATLRTDGIACCGRPRSKSMPERKPRSEWTTDEYREKTENARRIARFQFAEARIQKIVDGMPPFTEQQLARLVEKLLAGNQR